MKNPGERRLGFSLAIVSLGLSSLSMTLEHLGPVFGGVVLGASKMLRSGGVHQVSPDIMPLTPDAQLDQPM